MLGIRRQTLIGWLFVLPALAMYAVFVLQPLGLTVQYSLYRWDGVGPATWVGLSNYATVLSEPKLVETLFNAFRLVLFYSFIRRYELFRAGQVDTPLERIKEARTSADYGLAFAAVELLASEAGRDSLLDFWEQAGASGRWESVFPDVFGTTPAKFYREFAAYRGAGFQR